MSSTSEVGHAKNIANYSALIQILTEMGLIYQPSNTAIQLTNLTPIEAPLATSINILNTNLATYRISVADREADFKILDKRMTKVTNFFKSLNVDAKDKDIINQLVKKIRGDYKEAKVDPQNPDKDTHSTSQQSYDSLLANLRKLIAQLSEFPEYAPNETDIKVATLTTYADQLSTLTKSVNQSAAKVITSRTQRNDLLYFDTPNVIQLQRDIKAYLKSLGDEGKPYYEAAVRLKFRDIEK